MPTAYRFGVRNGSIPIFDRRKSGVEAEIKVGTVECKIVVGAIERGSVHEGRVWRVARIDRGGWVEGVSISFVRAMSSGARKMPARPTAETETRREFIGEGEDRISRPPAAMGLGCNAEKVTPGSGTARRADKRERKKEVKVERRKE